MTECCASWCARVLQLSGQAAVALQIVLNTDNEAGDLKSQLAYIYECIYVEYVIKNPLYVSGRPVE